MKKISPLQEDFFRTLSEIQEEIVQVSLSKHNSKDVEELLYDVTYETIYQIMEFIDGYTKKDLQLDLIEKNSKVSLRTDIELHDTCASFIKSSKQ